MKRRTFVAGSVSIGGAVAAFGLLEGCAGEAEQAHTSTMIRLQINGQPHEVTVDNRNGLLKPGMPVEAELQPQKQ